MRDFPKIDREAEDRAVRTLFFTESSFEGKTCRVAVANYLAFLSMRGPEVSDEVAKLRAALSEPDPQHLERDLIVLLQARNWRFHNIACVALAVQQTPSELLLTELWACLHLGSWSSPQLAAAAAFVDPVFNQRASSLVEDHSTYYKSIVSLATLLKERGALPPPPSMAEANFKEASLLDRDNSGSIASSWLQNLRGACSAA